MPRKKNDGTIENVIRFGLDDGFATIIQSYLANGGTLPPLPQALQDRLKFFLAARSDTEVRWNQFGKNIVADTFGSEVVFDGYEWLSFKVPGGTYTPDRACLLADGRWIFIEVKGSKKQTNYRDARSKLRGAAALNPWFIFCEAIVDKFGITVEEIKPDVNYVNDLLKFVSGGK
jgi:hypothetical protein